MTTILQKLYDGTGPIDSIDQWAKQTLSDDEYANFVEAQSRNMSLMAKYESDGLFTREPVTEVVHSSILGHDIAVQVGVNTILAPGITVLDIPIDPEFGAWHARYASDPNVNYNPTIQL